MITVITCRGTAEPVGGTGNLLTNVTRCLAAERFTLGPDLAYPASIGPVNPQASPLGPSENESIATGLVAIGAAIRIARNPVGLLGYSLGAELVSRFLEAKGRGEFQDCPVAFAGLVANPLRREGDSLTPDPAGFGIAGQHGPWPSDIPTWEAANPDDGITSCPPDSPLRPVSDVVSGLTFVGDSWTEDLLNRLRMRRWQPTSLGWFRHPVRTWRMYDTAAHMLGDYLAGYTHRQGYIDGGYCRLLAKAINAREL